MRGIIVPRTAKQVKQASIEATTQLQKQLPAGMACIVIIIDTHDNKFHWSSGVPPDVTSAIFQSCAANPHGRQVG